MVESGLGIECADQVCVLLGEAVDNAQHACSSAVYTKAGQKEYDHHHRDQQHHKPLNPIRQDVGMRAAEHDINQQH